MTACRASPIAVALALIALGTVPAVAQQGPIRLPPPRIIDTSPRVNDAMPRAHSGEATPVPAPSTEAPAGPKPEIVVGTPAPLDIDAIGTADEARGGLPATLWKGSNRAVVDRLIGLLPALNTSSASRNLAVRALTATGTPPAAAAEPTKTSFVGLRAAQLLAMGNVAAASDLARAVPRREDDLMLSRVSLDSALIGYDNAGACDLVRRQISRFDGPMWQQALIFCQALAGEHSRAQLGLSLLHEQRVDDPVFARLILALGGDQRPVSDVPAKPTPLYLALLRAARQNIPAAVAESNDPGLLRMVAQSPNTTAEARLAAAERAEAAGALSTEALLQVFDAVTFSADEMNNALVLAEKAPQARAHAALYRAAKAQTVGVARAEALARGWRIAHARGFYAGATRTTLPLLRELSPAPELAWFAADAGRALLIAGRVDEARRWYELARAEANAGGRTEQSEVLLAPLLRLAGGDAVPDSKGLAAWRAAQSKRDAEKAPQRAAMLTALLEGLGDGTDGSLSATLLAGDVSRQSVAMPHPALWLGRDGAAAAGRVGETALFVLDSLGAEGPGGAAPQTMVASIQALRAVNLEADARALAVEAAVLAGL